MQQTKIDVGALRSMKARGARIASLTAYDFPMTRLLDQAGIPLILVGDSLGMVVLGYPDTTHVTMEKWSTTCGRPRAPNPRHSSPRTCLTELRDS